MSAAIQIQANDKIWRGRPVTKNPTWDTGADQARLEWVGLIVDVREAPEQAVRRPRPVNDIEADMAKRNRRSGKARDRGGGR